jgi:hypothetical protein
VKVRLPLITDGTAVEDSPSDVSFDVEFTAP